MRDPGSGVFQTTFSLSLQRTGRFRRAAVPLVGRATIAGPILSAPGRMDRSDSSKPPPLEISRNRFNVFLSMVTFLSKQ